MDFPIDFRDYLIRPINSSDGKKYKEFENEIILENIHISRKDLKTDKECQWIAENIPKEIEKKRGVALAVEDNNQIVGYAGLFHLRQKSKHMADFGIMLSKKYRNQGLGTKLCKILFDWAKEHLLGLECIRLGVYALNEPAIKLYEKMGFTEVARIPRKYKSQHQYYDEIIMQLWIDHAIKSEKK